LGTGPSGQEGWGSTEGCHSSGDIGKETHIEQDIQEPEGCIVKVPHIERDNGEELESEEAGHIEGRIEEETRIVGQIENLHRTEEHAGIVVGILQVGIAETAGIAAAHTEAGQTDPKAVADTAEDMLEDGPGSVAHGTETGSRDIHL